MMILIEKQHAGCKVGDVVRFENKAEGLALVEAEVGTEVRWDEAEQTYVPVRRVSVEVTDGVTTREG